MPGAGRTDHVLEAVRATGDGEEHDEDERAEAERALDLADLYDGDLVPRLDHRRSHARLPCLLRPPRVAVRISQTTGGQASIDRALTAPTRLRQPNAARIFSRLERITEAQSSPARAGIGEPFERVHGLGPHSSGLAGERVGHLGETSASVKIVVTPWSRTRSASSPSRCAFGSSSGAIPAMPSCVRP